MLSKILKLFQSIGLSGRTSKISDATSRSRSICCSAMMDFAMGTIRAFFQTYLKYIAHALEITPEFFHCVSYSSGA